MTTAALTKAIEQMESEKVKLEASLARIQTKIGSEAQYQNVDFKGVFEATSQLRKLQEQQSQLQRRFVWHTTNLQ